MRFVRFADDTTDTTADNATDSDINNVHATVIRELIEVDLAQDQHNFSDR